MSTSILYHGFGILDHTYKSAEYAGGAITFNIVPKTKALRCPICRNRKVVCRGAVERIFRMVPIGSKPVWLRAPIQRLWCSKCQVVRQIKISFADPKKSYTKAFKRFVLDLSRWMSIRAVARHVGVSWDIVKGIQKQRLRKLYRKPRLKGLQKIAIDEISIGKGHKYLTLVLDLRTGRVVYAGEGKGAEALQPFWKRLKSSGARILAAAIDMSPAYIQAVIENLPGAALVFDRFHIVKMFNDKISDFRRKLHNRLNDPAEQKLLKGTRWLLLKNPEKLDPEKDEEKRLEQALEINKPLATIYYMKKDPRQLRNTNTLLAHKSVILKYYNFQISTGPLEGINNKIKTMKRHAY